MKGQQVEVTDEAAIIVNAANFGVVGREMNALIVNTTGDTVYLGGPDVDDNEDGFPLAEGAGVTVALVGEALYAICATGDSATLSILRNGD